MVAVRVLLLCAERTLIRHRLLQKDNSPLFLRSHIFPSICGRQGSTAPDTQVCRYEPCHVCIGLVSVSSGCSGLKTLTVLHATKSYHIDKDLEPRHIGLPALHHFCTIS